MILITGATGHLGGKTIDFLLKKSSRTPLVGLVRDVSNAETLRSKGVELRKGDYTDLASLNQALKGIDTLLLISSGTLQDRFSQHKNVVDAAKINNVKHIIYTSVAQASLNTKFIPGVDHFQTEEYLKVSGITYTILRNTFYSEVIPMLLGNALQSGEWYYAAGNSKANFASRADMAEALANVLVDLPHHKNKVYEITSGKAYSFNEVASILSKTVGKEIKYIPIPVEALKEGLKKAGVPDAYIPMLASIAEAIGDGELDLTDSSLEKLLGRKPEDLNTSLPKILAQPANQEAVSQ